MTERRIVVTRPIPQSAIRLLERAGGVEVAEDRALAREELLDAVRGADGLVTMTGHRIDLELLEAAGERLAVVANVAVGYDNVDLEACAARGVVVTNTPGVLVDATADLTLALLLATVRRVGEGDRLIRAGEPWTWSMTFMLGRTLRGLRLGLVGFGQIARAVAVRAQAFGMEVVASGRPGALPPGGGAAGVTIVGLDELLATSDVVSLHCPLTPATHHLLDAAALARMRPGAYLVNTARGPVVDEDALVDALERGALAGAGLDVFEHEPDVPDALRHAPNVVLTPHVGSATVETREAMALLAARNVVAVLAGEPPLTPVVARGA